MTDSANRAALSETNLRDKGPQRRPAAIGCQGAAAGPVSYNAPMFGRITPALRREIEDAVGADAVWGPERDLDRYSRDMTEEFRVPPELVVRPAAAEQVAALLRIAHRETIPVTPRSAGTSLSGGALPLHGGIVLAMERMNRILEIDEENLVAAVEPGVITQDLQEAVQRRGLYYPPDPASRGSCMLGGNVAHNAGGPHAVKYGVTRDWVLGLEALLADGRPLRTGGKLLKNVTGYNLTQLLIGSEGTLAVVTRILLKLVPYPPHRRALMASFPDLRSAAGAVAALFPARIVPSACEFIEAEAMRLVEERLSKRFPVAGGEASLLIEVDGTRPDAVEEEILRAGELCGEHGALEIVVAAEPARMEELWTLRRGVSEAIRAHSRYREQDVVVPRARLPELMDAIRDACSASGLSSLSFGHVGDGNVHVKVLRGDLDDTEWDRRIERATRRLFERVVALGGMLTGEHGVGYVQREFLPMALSPEAIGLMRAIKSVFDPKGILNPGKVFPTC
jgi:glycolate oxidase